MNTCSGCGAPIAMGRSEWVMLPGMLQRMFLSLLNSLLNQRKATRNSALRQSALRQSALRQSAQSK